MRTRPQLTAARLPSGACEIATRRWGTCAFTYLPRLPVLIGPGDHLVPLVLSFSAAHCLAPSAPPNLSPHTLSYIHAQFPNHRQAHAPIHVIQRRRSSDPGLQGRAQISLNPNVLRNYHTRIADALCHRTCCISDSRISIESLRFSRF